MISEKLKYVIVNGYLSFYTHPLRKVARELVFFSQIVCLQIEWIYF